MDDWRLWKNRFGGHEVIVKTIVVYETRQGIPA